MAPFKLRLRMGSSQEHDSDRQVNEALIPNAQSSKVRAAASSTTIDSTTDCNSLGSLSANECKSLLPNNSTIDYISWTSLQDIGNGVNNSAAALTTPPQLYDYELEEVGKKPHAQHPTSSAGAAVTEPYHPRTAQAYTHAYPEAASGSGSGAIRKYRYNIDSQNDESSLELQPLNAMNNEFNENELQQSISGGSNNNHNNNENELNNDVNNANDNDESDGDDDDDDDDDVSNEQSDRAGRSSSKETIDVAAAAATTPTSLTEQLLLVDNCEDDDCHCTEYSEGSGDECNDERCSSNCSCNKSCGGATYMDGNYMDGSERQMMMDGNDMWGAQQQQAEQYNESCLTQEILSHKSSKEIYKDLAKQWGITCKMSDGCRCMDCQSHYFDCEFDDNDHQKTDGGLGAGTPMFLSELHGSACNIL